MTATENTTCSDAIKPKKRRPNSRLYVSRAAASHIEEARAGVENMLQPSLERMLKVTGITYLYSRVPD